MTTGAVDIVLARAAFDRQRDRGSIWCPFCAKGEARIFAHGVGGHRPAGCDPDGRRPVYPARRNLHGAMRRTAALTLALAALVPPTGAAAQASDPRLVPDVSSRAIDIQYSFTGEELLLFGAILYPGQRLPDDRADIVVVLKGAGASDRAPRKAAGGRDMGQCQQHPAAHVARFLCDRIVAPDRQVGRRTDRSHFRTRPR